MIRFRLAEQIEKKQFNEGRRITVGEVAESTGVNRMTLSKILNQRGYSTGTEILDKLCTYFDCRIEDLVEYVKTPVD
jgi:DNA-binding Xre family transcriptional regulator